LYIFAIYVVETSWYTFENMQTRPTCIHTIGIKKVSETLSEVYSIQIPWLNCRKCNMYEDT